MPHDLWVDRDIRHWAENGGIRPYEPKNINPASIDLRIGSPWIDITYPDTIHNKTLVLYPRDSAYELFYRFIGKRLGKPHRTFAALATTMEHVNFTDRMAGMIKLKTTPTRMGLGHPIADWIDPGFCGQLTMALHTFKPISLPVGLRIVQLVILDTVTPDLPYSKTGHYQGQLGPTPAWKGYNEPNQAR